MSKFIVAPFKNAKLFRNSKNGSCKDFVIDPEDPSGYRKRMDKLNKRFDTQFVEPLTIYQISNILHVLFGERPVPSNRVCYYEKNNYLFDKAGDCYLKLTDSSLKNPIYKKYNSNTDQYELTSEILQVNKSSWNSWNPNPQINWDIIKRYLGSDDNINWFFSELIDILNTNPLNHDVDKVRLTLFQLNPTHLFDGLKQRKRTALVTYILTNKTSDIIKSNDRVQLTINKGIEKVNILNGVILIPVNDDDIQRIRQSKGHARVLDGGYLWIDSIVNADEYIIDGFTLVKDISTEKY